MSKGMVDLMLNNLIEDSRTNRHAAINDSLSSEQDTEWHKNLVSHTVLQIKEDEDHRDFKNNNISTIKVELVEDFEMLNDSQANPSKLETEINLHMGNTKMLENRFDHLYCKVFGRAQYKYTKMENEIFSSKTTPHIKNENSAMCGTTFEEWTANNEISLTNENVDFDEARPKDILQKPFEALVKTKNSDTEMVPEVVHDKWVIKNEEIYIKEEDLLEEQASMSSGSSNHEKQRYLCNMCEYQTDQRGNLKKHFLKHKNPEEVDFFRCDKCEYQTRYRSCLKRHCLKHKSPEEVVLFSCHKCEYQTRYRSSLKRHCLKHNSPKEVFFRCDKCEYKTCYIGCLRRHFLKHENSKEFDFLKCDKCEYRTNEERHLDKHLLEHGTDKNPFFRCDKCEYRTIRKRYLNWHLLKHENLKEIAFFRCEKCPFQTLYKSNLKKHFLKHNRIG